MGKIYNLEGANEFVPIRFNGNFKINTISKSAILIINEKYKNEYDYLYDLY